MNDFVICAERLGKKYSIGHKIERESYTALRDIMARSVKGLARSAMDMVRSRQLVDGTEVEEFWALKDISFEIKRGEVVGIIGRNGAGKSTLLKILSRITEPSEGRVQIRGRVASLLEVGTGFHPELTGRENIYLNGAILGMTRAEIHRKFNEIVAFAELQKFLDTPVKRYSSGMYVRLAFAVAAHLEPEILVVDEVLAVGDAEFQRKCLGKMSEVAGHGRTVLFVSHNMSSLVRICERGILLNNGGLALSDDIANVVSNYARQQAPNSGLPPGTLFESTRVKNTNMPIIVKAILADQYGDHKQVVRPYDRFRIRLLVRSPTPISQGSVIIEFRTMDGFAVAKIESSPADQLLAHEGEYWVDCSVDSLTLREGNYMMSFGTAIYGVRRLDWHPDVATLVVIPSSDKTLGEGPAPMGVVLLKGTWDCALTSAAT
jgi:lipopolysaccharide transport system ATP-binding protein